MKATMAMFPLTMVICISFASDALAGGARSNDPTVSEIVCPGFDNSPGTPESINAGLTCYSVVGWSNGNHEIDCTVIVPDRAGSQNPLIVWANGWDQGNVLGQCTSNGYLKGLKLWAKGGSYVVAVANQWSVQESDVLACAQWIDENDGQNGIPSIDPENIGLVGHSQGGGAVVKAGSGNKDISIKAVLAMNPYGPAWVRPEEQTGQVLILGGRMDTTTPLESYDAVVDAIITEGDPGGINAVSLTGTHNSDAWGTYDEEGLLTMSCEDAAKEDFGNFQAVGLAWWEANLKLDPPPGYAKMAIVNGLLCNAGIWEVPEHGGIEGFTDCP